MKTKIVFAGVMGAILMSAGANAATTSVATKGYVDQQVKGVQTTVNTLQENSITMQDVADAIGASLADGKIDLSGYQLTANMVTTALAEVAAGDQGTKYPSVGAVLSAIDTKIEALGLSPEQIESLKDLLGADGVAASITALQTDVAGLKTQVGTGTVADQIASAITEHTTAADGKYQAQSTVDLSVGTTGGVFRPMNDAEKAALASGVTKEKVTAYDALTGDTGTVAELQKAINGLNGEDGTITTITETVNTLETLITDESTGLQKSVATNAANIKTNSDEIAKRILTPTAECTGPESTCVLMIQGNNVVWTPVTSPVNDSTTGGSEGGEG